MKHANKIFNKKTSLMHSNILLSIFENSSFCIDSVDDKKIRISSSSSDIKKQIEDYIYYGGYKNYLEISDLFTDWSFTNGIYFCYITLTDCGIDYFTMRHILFESLNKTQKNKEIKI